MERKQTSLRQNPAITEVARSMTYPMRGIVKTVRYQNTSRGKRTSVDLVVLDMTGQSTPDYQEAALTHVPLLYQKMNAQNGEEWSPEKGDLVAIGFFNADISDPFVMGYLGPYQGEVMDPGTDPHPQSFRKRSGSWERIDNVGNRQTEIAGNESQDVKGQRTTVIEGTEAITVTSGDVTIAVVAGKCTVTVKGKTSWTSEGGIDHIGKAGGTAKGNVQGDCICAFTRKPHPMVSATVKSSL